MEFHDFEIRAWEVGADSLQVLVHRSPVGDLRQPMGVPLDWGQLEAFRSIFDAQYVSQDVASWQSLIEGGRRLAQYLLPPPVFSLLVRSLERIPPEDGLRIRLCLTEKLVDLPWEYLYRPDAYGDDIKNFLALDARISLVREAPRFIQQAPSSQNQQHLLFAGASFWLNGSDIWKVDEEEQQLRQALEPVSQVLAVDSMRAPHTPFAAGLVNSPQVDIFHYAGHSEIVGAKGVLLEEIRTDPVTDAKYTVWEDPSYQRSYGVDRLYVDLMDSAHLAQLLRKAGTTLAVFSACNSGRWPFVKPLVHEGIPVVVGTQGLVLVNVIVNFCRTFYSALAVGLSLDEAITWARLHLLEPGVLPVEQQWQWGRFMVYMVAQDATLFPKEPQGLAGEQQQAARNERNQTIINVYQTIGAVHGGQVVGVQKHN
jgi:hypothetical protein